MVAGKLKEDWSPRQIAGWLARTFAPKDGMYVSHETIYKSLFIQARGVLKKELVSHLRRRPPRAGGGEPICVRNVWWQSSSSPRRRG
jgi:IS30 family transposase